METMLRKKIKRYGNTRVITITPEEMELYDLKDGDIIECPIIKIERGGKKK